MNTRWGRRRLDKQTQVLEVSQRARERATENIVATWEELFPGNPPMDLDRWANALVLLGAKPRQVRVALLIASARPNLDEASVLPYAHGILRSKGIVESLQEAS